MAVCPRTASPRAPVLRAGRRVPRPGAASAVARPRKPSRAARTVNDPERLPVSVVVPAHDEAAVIGRCLRALTEGSDPGEVEVVVVCNGCRDDTAASARAAWADVVVAEVPEAS